MHYVYEWDGHTHFLSEGSGGPVRLLACPTQVPLITRMLGGKESVELCSRVPEIEGPPERCLARMQSLKLPPAEGGWRVFNLGECSALGLSRAFLDSKLDSLESMQTLMEHLGRHPLVRAGGLFHLDGGCSIDFMAYLSCIYDIRRFSTLSKLRSSFKLVSAAGVRELSQQGLPFSSISHPVGTAVGAWFCPAFALASADGIRKLPRAFLYRDLLDWRARYEKSHEEFEAALAALWRATLRHLSFTHKLWTAAVLGVPFEPEKFFRRPDEVAEFKSYIARLDSSIDNSAGTGNVNPEVRE
jgi:hypothetical protein